MASFKFDYQSSTKLINDINQYVKALYLTTQKLYKLTNSSIFWNDEQRVKINSGIEMVKGDIKKSMEAEVAYSNFYKEIVKEFTK